MQPDQLAALAAIVEHGTFEAAARSLHVTTSAVSQRIRALEASAGQVLVRRSAPCEATAAGATLVRLARQWALVHGEAVAELGAATRGVVDLPVAVNADSLATWFRTVVGEVAGWDAVTLRLHVEDQGWSSDLLRRGDVLAAVTSDPVAVQGCTVEPLGAMRYRPAATPAYAERWRRGRGYDWARMPVVVFNEKDALQHELLVARGLSAPPVVHRVPTSADFHEAVRLGLGWGAAAVGPARPRPRLGAARRPVGARPRRRTLVLAAVAPGVAGAVPADRRRAARGAVGPGVPVRGGMRCSLPGDVRSARPSRKERSCW